MGRLMKAEKLKIGDKVLMNDRYRVSEKNKGKVFVVRSEPFEICGGGIRKSYENYQEKNGSCERSKKRK